ncbi:NADPH-dependent F420 reductase [Micromonospora chersina]|uniref:NADPH-dependent F420 reductase n=1 Tax=Micromonospora chersina TaxID=47854 RepID=UPI0036A20E62
MAVDDPARADPAPAATVTLPSRPRLAVLGAGHTGPVIARVAMAAGYPVTIAASGDPVNIALIADVLAPGAEARWAADAVADAGIVVLAIPLHRFPSLDPDLLADRLVVDTMNYWPPVDGVQAMFDDPRYGSSEIVQRRLARATVVKTLNHIGYHELGAAVRIVADLIERIGYDAVRLDGLRAGRLLQPGGPVFGVPLGRTGFARALAG